MGLRVARRAGSAGRGRWWGVGRGAVGVGRARGATLGMDRVSPGTSRSHAPRHPTTAPAAPGPGTGSIGAVAGGEGGGRWRADGPQRNAGFGGAHAPGGGGRCGVLNALWRRRGEDCFGRAYRAWPRVTACVLRGWLHTRWGGCCRQCTPFRLCACAGAAGGYNSLHAARAHSASSATHAGGLAGGWLSSGCFRSQGSICMLLCALLLVARFCYAAQDHHHQAAGRDSQPPCGCCCCSTVAAAAAVAGQLHPSSCAWALLLRRHLMACSALASALAGSLGRCAVRATSCAGSSPWAGQCGNGCLHCNGLAAADQWWHP